MNKLARVSISLDDIFSYRIRDAEETIDMFGEDFLVDYGHDISEELLLKYKKIMKDYKELQDQLKIVYQNEENRND